MKWPWSEIKPFEEFVMYVNATSYTENITSAIAQKSNQLGLEGKKVLSVQYRHVLIGAQGLRSIWLIGEE